MGLALSGWLFFAVAFFTRPKTPSGPERGRDPRSTSAVAVQAVGFALVWGWRRGPGANLLTSGAWQDALQLLAVAILAWGSAALATSAVRTLGKQWSVTARVLSEHRLITTGPYAIVRHPIYTAMFGLLLATGIALTTGPSLFAAAGIFLAGTFWRVRIEERLLRQTCGAEYGAYAAQVPAVIPWWRPRRRSA